MKKKTERLSELRTQTESVDIFDSKIAGGKLFYAFFASLEVDVRKL